MGLFEGYDDRAKRGGAGSGGGKSGSDGGGGKNAKQLSADQKAKLSRVATRTPEVMVKVTGHAKGAAQLKAHTEYMTRKGEVTAYTQDGDGLESQEAVAEVRDEWVEADSDSNQPNQRLTTNIALSIRDGDPDKLLDAGQAFAARNFENHDYLLVMHQDTEHPHLHLTVRNTGHDGQKLHIPKGRPQEWRESFAGELRERGIAAEATSRAERGKVRKGERGGIRHIRERKTPERDKQAVSEAAQDKPRDEQSQPWRAKIQETQNAKRALWRQVAEDLADGNEAEQRVSQQARQFLKQMPRIETREDQIRRELTSERSQEPDRDQSQEAER